ncbi:hypothetical protein [Leptolyngbya sp. FACHB-261]|uniref:hypothetical protein n=1 Tax=Leptolyngbya sp. FACHB-261 TaxID=2692806 RepID=UPI00168819F9|nr:hypothetical protein [Leptolyngbya sp. FACHB-261]MBD2100857.1 hypothetical protein [Leptolyngbya sp. FACHB-261]
MNAKFLQTIGLIAVGAFLVYTIAHYADDAAYSLWRSMSYLRYSLMAMFHSLWKLLAFAVVAFALWKVFFSR